MKATDLMIGDWGQGFVPDTYSRVVSIPYAYRLGIITSGGHYIETAPDDFQPIPLTPEILEKNGFDWGYTASEEDFCSATGCGYPEEKGWCFDEGAGEIKIIFPNDTDGGLIRLDDQCADRHWEILFLKPIYVHELQHALRLCGIEKEITLN